MLVKAIRLTQQGHPDTEEGNQAVNFLTMQRMARQLT